MKKILNNCVRNEKGQAMPLVLILLLIGGLIIGPLMGLMSTGIRAGQTHEQLMERLYAADAGVEDALWQIQELVTSLPDYGDPSWMYQIAVNGKQVDVEISYKWLLDGLESDANGTLPHAELVAVGRPIDLATGLYEIEITYDGTTGVVWVERIAVWLPLPFDYVDGSAAGITTDPPSEVNIATGHAFIWDLSPREKFDEGVTTTKIQSFNFTPVGRYPRGNFAWIRTSRMDIWLAWNGTISKYVIKSTATDITTGKQTEVVANAFWEDSGNVGISTWEINLQ